MPVTYRTSVPYPTARADRAAELDSRDEYIRKNWRTQNGAEIAQALGCGRGDVYRRAKALGLMAKGRRA